MAFDTSVDINEPLYDDNPYISDAQKAFELSRSIIDDSVQTVKDNIDKTLFNIISCCEFLFDKQDYTILEELKQSIELIKNPLKFSLFNEYTTFGFGGTFSAGKSAVLNSIVGDATYLLPENNDACTSVSTYIRYDKDSNVVLSTKNNKKITLNEKELEAISHKFSNEYKFNIAQYIDFISLGVSSLSFMQNIALLDTPGYNAANTLTKQEFTDKERAKLALSSVDYLVWLVSAKEPVLRTTDISFIKSLHLSKPIILLVNRCDLRQNIYESDDPQNTEEFHSLRNDLEKAEINYEHIIPYTAREPMWHNCRENLIKVLIDYSKQKDIDHKKKINNIIALINDKFKKLSKNYQNDIKNIDKQVGFVSNPVEISSVVKLRGILGSELAKLSYNEGLFNDYSKELVNWVNQQIV